jgi:CBS domain containing-hemolysin-like protein
MRKIFQHKYFVGLLAFIALTMALVSISAPEIEIYNNKIKAEQRKIRKEADGSTGRDDREISFSLGNHYSTNPTFFAEVALFLTLFFSLSLTKRISFSLFLSFLYYCQFITFLEIFCLVVEFPMSYFFNTPVYSILFVSCVIGLSYWEASIISRFSHGISLGLKKQGNI